MKRSLLAVGQLPAVAAIGDAFVFVVFAAAGRSSHHEASSALRVLGTALPFLVGWFGAAALWRVYAGRFFGSYPSGLRRVALTWLTGWVAALAIRSALEHRIAPPGFAVIALLFNGSLLLAWRVAVIAARRRLA